MGARVSHLADLIAAQERDEALREMEIWRAAYLMREVVKTNEPKDQEHEPQKPD
jgi:hypothetical protein